MAEKTITKPELIVDQPLNDPWKQVMVLPCRLRVEAPVAVFTVADLLGLSPGSLVRSSQKEGSPASVQVNGQVIGWGEFDVVEDALAIRLTELCDAHLQQG
jgi:flagellar motor switch/type III secretory pathway protein FliN